MDRTRSQRQASRPHDADPRLEQEVPAALQELWLEAPCQLIGLLPGEDRGGLDWNSSDQQQHVTDLRTGSRDQAFLRYFPEHAADDDRSINSVADLGVPSN